MIVQPAGSIFSVVATKALLRHAETMASAMSRGDDGMVRSSLAAQGSCGS